MLKSGNIREYKIRLRAEYRRIRGGMGDEAKEQKDRAVLRHILSLPEYRAARTILCYVSKPAEVDTRALIAQALSDGKCVAVPRCVEGSRRMYFYRIHSLGQLSPGTFGVPEPDSERCERLRDYSRSVCILPGLAFDRQGYRLGYGGGYYDRFLSHTYQNHGSVIGICYSECVRGKLPRGRYDVPCDVLVTDRQVHRPSKMCKAPGSQGL